MSKRTVKDMSTGIEIDVPVAPAPEADGKPKKVRTSFYFLIGKINDKHTGEVVYRTKTLRQLNKLLDLNAAILARVYVGGVMVVRCKPIERTI